jgi:hypothetical protein
MEAGAMSLSCLVAADESQYSWAHNQLHEEYQPFNEGRFQAFAEVAETYDHLEQWFSNFFDMRHKNSLRFGRGTLPSKIYVTTAHFEAF